MRGFGGFFPFKIWKHLFVFANFIFPKLDILPALFCAIPNDLLLSRFWQGLVHRAGSCGWEVRAYSTSFPARVPASRFVPRQNGDDCHCPA